MPRDENTGTSRRRPAPDARSWPALVVLAAWTAATAAAPAPVAPATPAAAGRPHVIGWTAGATPAAPPGFRVRAFARGLDAPRNLLVLPNGDVLVVESHDADASGGRPAANRITLLRDADGDGTADLQTVLVDGLDRPYGIALRRDRLYVANSGGVVACPFFVGQTRITGSCKPLLELPSDPHDPQPRRNLVLSPDEATLYVAVGGGADGEHAADDAWRGTILAVRPDGKNPAVHASGLANPVGMAFEPSGGRLWTTVCERDGLGDELPPDFMTAVRPGAFYGWPWAYFGTHEDPRRAGARPDRVAKAVTPDLALGAHVAPLGLAFYRRDAFPAEWRSGAYVALHGSVNRSTLAGYEVRFVPFAGGRPTGAPRTFLGGFVADVAAGEVHGRPAAVAVAKDGALLVADDAGNTVWYVSPPGTDAPTR
jgi:glucose/arabinose dehydrogenase